jgi:hypothetical protein
MRRLIAPGVGKAHENRLSLSEDNNWVLRFH